MLKTNAPTKFTVPFAASGTKNTIPVTASPTTGLASYTTGFTAVNMEPIASGGVPPAGNDFNGIHFDATNAMLWKQSGFQYAFDSAWAANANIGGYPAQALLARADGKGFWLNLSDNNTTNPDAASPSGWVAVRANMGTSTIAVSGATTTPDLSILGAPVLIVTGTLTANSALVLPLTAGANWIVENNTTGAFNLTIQGSTGTGVQVATGNPSQVYTDGTNFYATTANVSGLYLPIGGNAVSASKLANARAFSLAGPVTATGVNFDGTGNIILSTAIANGALNIAMTNGLSSALSALMPISGGTFTGNVSIVPTSGTAGMTFTSAAGTSRGFNFTSGGSPRWAIYGATLDPEMGGNTGSNIAFGRYSDTGAFIDTPFSISRQTGLVTTGAGGIASAGDISANQNIYATSANLVLASSGGGSGSVYIRPQGVGITTGQTFFGSNGVVTFGGDVNIYENIKSQTGNFVVAPGSSGLIYLRPGGIGVTSTQTVISNTGTMTVAGSITCTTLSASSSDERLKEHITPAAPRPLHRVLPFVAYDWRDKSLDKASGLGVIAQNVLAVEPLYVTSFRKGGDDTDYLAVSVSSLAYEQAIWAGWEIDRLSHRVARLESRK